MSDHVLTTTSAPTGFARPQSSELSASSTPPRSDGIPARVLKACSAELARPLSKLFTCCLRSGIQPQQWKVAHVVPVHKRKSKSSPSNYRPVSLLSILFKVMETIDNRAISNFHSAADLLTALHHQWVHTAGDKGASRVLAIDIAGAFDRVSHTGIAQR